VKNEKKDEYLENEIYLIVIKQSQGFLRKMKN
jgi:hypothetical protein